MNKRSYSNGSVRRSLFCLLALATLTNATPQGSSTNSDDDKIYDSREVDKKAVIYKERDDRNLVTDVGCIGHGLVIIRAVLRKSGNVTDVQVVEKGGCSSLEQKATKAVERTKFRPAKKDGAFVSTRKEFQFKYDCDHMRDKRCR